MRDLTPRQIVTELDRHIIGQQEAKRAVAVAIRNRWRRQHVSGPMRGEIAPKNILMIGPTGVGKTEIARRLAQLTGAPFIKVEATKFTEVGYHGRDVESMIRELVDNAVTLVKDQEREKVREEATRRAEERLLDLLVPPPPAGDEAAGGSPAERHARSREKMRARLAAGEMSDCRLNVPVEQKPQPVLAGELGLEHLEFDFQGMFEKILPRSVQKREMGLAEARQVLFEQECEALVNKEQAHARAVELAENLGIIFLDEIDKVVASEEHRGTDVSRQGVQRDLLPVVEGTTVQTKYGYVRTDHILFIAAGAFHRAKPSDLMPELQGRFPIRVELSDLGEADFVRILTEPDGALTKQYQALLAAENVTLEFRPDAIKALARFTFQVNQSQQNIGARRLYTIMERLLEEISFDAPDLREKRIVIDEAHVRSRLEKLSEDEDLSRFIL